MENVNGDLRSSDWNSDEPIDSNLSVILKRAVIVGVRYTDFDKTYRDQVKDDPESGPLGSFAFLPNTQHDCDTMQRLLEECYGFLPENIAVLKDNGKETPPTKANICRALEDLLDGVKAGDHLVFHYSGHGSQTATEDRQDEEDGFDEIILPCDVIYNPDKDAYSVEEFSNYIKDNDLNDLLVKRLPEGVYLTVILDCCHSGTGVDLRFDNTHPTRPDDMEEVMSPLSIESPTDAFPLPSFEGQAKTLLSGRQPAGASKQSALNSKLPFVAKKRSTDDSGNATSELEHVRQHHHRSDKTKHVTSWAACLDDQVTLEDSTGGILTNALNAALRTNRNLTNKELLDDLSQQLEKISLLAKASFKESELPKPYPVLGSIVSLDEILDKPFSF